MDYNLLNSALISIILGFLIGLERSLNYHMILTGGRTFALVSLLGFLSAYISEKTPYFLTASFILFSLINISLYIVKSIRNPKKGLTTNIAMFITYLLGVLIFFKNYEFATIIAVSTIVILNLKEPINKIESKITPKEINAGILLLVMSFILLPILPNTTIDPWHLINPYKIWLMAVIIASLSFIGYLGIKFFGENKGILITGAAGGFISSTAVTISLSAFYNSTKTNIYNYAAGIAIANTLMFIRVLVETYITNPSLAYRLSSIYLLTFIYGLGISFYFYKKGMKNLNIQIESLQKSPLELNSAIKFAIIFGLIYALVEFTNTHYGDKGIIIVSLISGLTDVDAITLSLGELSKHSLESKDAINGIICASLSNTLVKFFIVVFSSKELSKTIALFFIPELIILSIGLYLL
jgi:uncharacterized membrane protein (DUF4010 family)